MAESKKQDKLPTIDIHGKEYVMVKDRVVAFNKANPNGSINTKIVKFDGQNVIIRATVYPDVTKPERKFSDYAAEIVGGEGVNKTSAIENCSTSAVGRALAYMGIGVVDSIASADEVKKAENAGGTLDRKATPGQVTALRNMVIGFSNHRVKKDSVDKAIMSIVGIEDLNDLKFQDASELMDTIKRDKKVPLDFDESDRDFDREEDK